MKPHLSPGRRQGSHGPHQASCDADLSAPLEAHDGRAWSSLGYRRLGGLRSSGIQNESKPIVRAAGPGAVLQAVRSAAEISAIPTSLHMLPFR